MTTESTPAGKPSETPKAKAQPGNRSPNYPQMNFAQAVERIKKVYDVETTHSVPDKSIAEALGYTTLNGTSRTTLSALKKYGLLVPSGDGFKVGQEAQRIIELSGPDPERVTAIRKLALRPPVYKQLQEKFPGKSLPSDSTLRLFLMDTGFEKDAANQVVRFYKETLQYLEKEAPDQALNQAAKENSASEKPIKTEENTRLDADQPLPKPAHPSSSESVHLRLRISRECNAEIAFFGPVTEEAISKLIRHLELSKDDYPSLAEMQKQSLTSPASVVSPEVSGVTNLFDQDEDEDYDNSDEDYSDLDDAVNE